MVGNSQSGTVSFLDAVTFANLGTFNAIPDLQQRLAEMDPIQAVGASDPLSWAVRAANRSSAPRFDKGTVPNPTTRRQRGEPTSGGRVYPLNRPFLMLGAPPSNHSAGGEWEQDWAALGGYKKWLTVANADHFSFSDLDLLHEEAGFATPPLSPERGVVITREYVTAFFDKTLKGIHSPLPDGPAPNNPEVLFQH
ncbi:hypothetical protein ACGF12_36555 [Kitasatospora sp. NPDC048296]|uniref:hypothetical protein n=1 Tax=Kitasatospora sp. NPDC048296 TaxID=3364048 RepID=UPI003712F01B